MRRGKASRRSRWLSLAIAALVGFLIGDWRATALRSVDLSPTQNVALRFPEAKLTEAKAETAIAVPAAPADPSPVSGVLVPGDDRLALLSPDPMVPARARQPAPVAAAVQSAAATVPPGERAARALPQPRPEMRPPALADARHASRPGFVLNDAQIASIKNRLHMSVDQEQMWPAVEAALRNIAYAKARDARRHGAAGGTESAALDPESAEVQGLKAAAVPLIMSFNDEQRSEVRSLAHVMGLDQLASQF
jgi:hypothetical protein